jgi:hypothetical protein
MLAATRHNPHLRLTAAILVAVLAALAGGLESGISDDANQRGRRAEHAAALAALKFVSLPSANADHAAFVHALGAELPRAPLSVAGSILAFDTAEIRALRRERLDASRASRAALLKTTALPPPMA